MDFITRAFEHHLEFAMTLRVMKCTADNDNYGVRFGRHNYVAVA
jgi:hypothetical protein